MAGYAFKPIVEEDLPDVAAFLFEQREITSRTDWTQARPVEDDLRWLLDNPHLRPELNHGETLRGPEGKIFGMILAVPRMYQLGDQRLLGLAAGNFYVDASVRLQGFFMLKRFLGTQGVEFCYANSCNRQSAPLWAKCGAALVPESDVEYLFPFNLGSLAEEWAIRKELPTAVHRVLRTIGPLASLVAAPRCPVNRFTLEKCLDLECLAAIAARNRNPQWLQPERSVPYLRWCYGTAIGSGESEGGDQVVYRFADQEGLEGWFALTFDRRGRNNQIRSARLVDAVWPNERLSFTDVLPAVIAAARPRSDLLSIRGRVGLALQDGAIRGLRRRPLLAPEGCLTSKSPSSAELAKLADFPFADRY
jgi:hypothetical protein